jgi:hypothetical protein
MNCYNHDVRWISHHCVPAKRKSENGPGQASGDRLLNTGHFNK